MINPFNVLGAKIFAGVAAAALIGLAVQTVRIEGAFCRQVKVGEKPACIFEGFKQEIAGVRIDLEQVRADRAAEIAKHQATKQAYADAQAEAEKLEAARLARVTALQQEITDDRVQVYSQRLAAARADFDRLRRAQGSAARGGAAGAGQGFAMPGVPDAAGGADGAAGDHRLSDDERFVATKQAIQLDELQNWIRRQATVPTN